MSKISSTRNYIIYENRQGLLLIRDSQSIGYVLLAALLVVALAFGRGSAQQQLSAVADSLTEGVGGGADVSKHFQRVLVDSISPEVIAKLVKEINPVVTPNNTRRPLFPRRAH